MKEEQPGLGGISVHGVDVSTPKVYSKGDSKKNKFVPSNALFAAVARPSNNMEEGPWITMRDASTKLPAV